MKKPASSLKWKARLLSAEALLITLAVHALLLLLAGTIVAVRYIQKQTPEFTVSTAAPRLERRQLELPAEPRETQETARRPAIVSRPTAAARPAFAVPDMGRAAELDTRRSALPGTGSGPDFSAIPRGFASDPDQVRFFNIRARGEKMIFVIDASPQTVDERVGGHPAFEHVKQEVLAAVGQMRSSVLFNVLLYDGEKVALFRERMVPATVGHREALAQWIAPFNQKGDRLPGLAEEQDTYVPPMVYDTAMGPDAFGWVRGLQSALEQRADTVFITGTEWGQHRISAEKRQRMLDFSLWELLGGTGPATIAGSPALSEDRDLRSELIRQAVTAIAREDRERPRTQTVFVRDILNYVTYSPRQVLDHADTVYRARYLPLNLARPQVHFVRQIPGRSPSIADPDTARMRNLVRNYNGELVFFRGQEVLARLRDPEAVVAESMDVPGEVTEDAMLAAVESDVRFFGTRMRGARLAFILNAGREMFDPLTGSEASLRFAADQLLKTIHLLEPGTQVYVVAYNEKGIAPFTTQMRPASEQDGLREWLEALSAEAHPPDLTQQEKLYQPAIYYPSAIGDDVVGQTGAIQAAMEQQADCIVLFSAGTGFHPVRRDKARRLVDFAVWNAIGATVTLDEAGVVSEGELTDNGIQDGLEDIAAGDGTLTDITDQDGAAMITAIASGTVSGGLLQELGNDRRQRAELIRHALRRIAEEKENRRTRGATPGFLPDLLDHIGYLPEHVRSHLDAVAQYQYGRQEHPMPRLHFIHLMERNVRIERDEERALRNLIEPFGGDLRIYRGAFTEEDIRRNNRLLDLHP